MRAYEMMYIVRPHLDEETTKSVIEKFKSVVETEGGQVDNVDEMGKRRLAYEIDDLNEGYYVVMNFTSDSDVVQELERQVGLSDQVLRHIVVREDE